LLNGGTTTTVVEIASDGDVAVSMLVLLCKLEFVKVVFVVFVVAMMRLLLLLLVGYVAVSY
jgi:hypothetical protein